MGWGWRAKAPRYAKVARQFRLAASTVRVIDLRYLQRWSATRRRDRLEQMGVDEIYFGKQMKFITVVSNLETGEPLWFGQIAPVAWAGLDGGIGNAKSAFRIAPI